MDDELLAQIFAKLNEAQEILIKEIPLPDKDVFEWNQTPIGRAVGRIGDAIELLDENRD
jgi:hypothetical protein